MNKLLKTISTSMAVFLLSLFLSACGGGYGGSGGGNSEPPVVNIGTFIDSNVGGIEYRTPTQSGITSLNGKFSYVDGESVTFSIGGIDLPSAPAQAILTPLNLVDTTNYNDTAVTNIARLLQTLDTDGDTSNGITIAEEAHTYAAGMSIDFGASSFDSDVAGFVANSGSSNTTLIDGATAITHLQTTISNVKNNSSWKVAQPHTHQSDFNGSPYNWHCSDYNLAACQTPVWGVMRIVGVMYEHSEIVDSLGWYDRQYNCQPTISISLNGDVKNLSPYDDSGGGAAWFPVPENKAIWCAAHTSRKVNYDDQNAISLGTNSIDRFLEFSCSDRRAIPSGSSLSVSLNYSDALEGGATGNYDCQGYLGEAQHGFYVEFEGEGTVQYPSGAGVPYPDGTWPQYLMSPPNGNTWAMQMDMDPCTDYGSDTKPYCQSIAVVGNGTNLPIQSGTYQGADYHWVNVDATANTITHYYGSSTLSCMIYAGYSQYEYLSDGTVKETEFDENGVEDEVFTIYPIADYETALVDFMGTDFTLTTEPLLPICDVSAGGDTGSLATLVNANFIGARCWDMEVQTIAGIYTTIDPDYENDPTSEGCYFNWDYVNGYSRFLCPVGYSNPIAVKVYNGCSDDPTTFTVTGPSGATCLSGTVTIGSNNPFSVCN